MNKTEKRKELLQKMRKNLNMVYETIQGTGNLQVYDIEWKKSLPLKAVLKNLDGDLEQLENIEQQSQVS
jgi:hypothetical protein